MSLIGKMELTDFFEKRIGRGRLVLLRYGPGSGGEILLKEFVSSAPAGMNAVFISSTEGAQEIGSEAAGHMDKVEVISLLGSVESESARVLRRDRFASEGILVTDLLEISMADRTQKDDVGDMLSMVTLASTKQVMPFRLALDSLQDLIRTGSEDEIVPRLMILRKVVRSVQGTALIGAPLDWNGLHGKEMSLFDCLLEARSVKGLTGFERRLSLTHLRNDPLPPDEWPINLRSH